MSVEVVEDFRQLGERRAHLEVVAGRVVADARNTMKWRSSDTMLVASTGGHLAQMFKLAPRIEPDPARRVWVTFDTPQSRSLLDDAEWSSSSSWHPARSLSG